MMTSGRTPGTPGTMAYGTPIGLGGKSYTQGDFDHIEEI